MLSKLAFLKHTTHMCDRRIFKFCKWTSTSFNYLNLTEARMQPSVCITQQFVYDLRNSSS